MKKLLSLLGAMGMVATSSSVAVACNNGTSVKDLSTIKTADLTVAPTANDEAAAKKAVLAQINAKLSVKAVETTDVVFSKFSQATSAEKAGSIVATAAEKSTLVKGTTTFVLTFKSAEASSKTELLAQIKVKNSDASALTEDDFDIASEPAISATAAKITAKGDKYQGSVSLTYSKGEASSKAELSSVIKTLDLGAFSFSESTPSKTELLAQIKVKNSDASALTEDDFDIASEPAISATAAKITAKGDKYQGSVSLTYSKG
ncbi:lipoprotein [Spiroplasma tabanidicola]|uniref:Spiralin-like protein n=1 Tax=Spiroplasma tabanidicola TaxID=324079 RepID=A0A6I6C7L6_9MOLU|nr:lipoprotein [Spiroplasma tabanidicola]QGS51419.1 hypothetical protein STABA_v1c00520 [Spiroplasma tabanidicola]